LATGFNFFYRPAWRIDQHGVGYAEMAPQSSTTPDRDPGRDTINRWLWRIAVILAFVFAFRAYQQHGLLNGNSGDMIPISAPTAARFVRLSDAR
jgi:hypothetical protein